METYIFFYTVLPCKSYSMLCSLGKTLSMMISLFAKICHCAPSAVIYFLISWQRLCRVEMLSLLCWISCSHSISCLNFLDMLILLDIDVYTLIEESSSLVQILQPSQVPTKDYSLLSSVIRSKILDSKSIWTILAGFQFF